MNANSNISPSSLRGQYMICPNPDCQRVEMHATATDGRETRKMQMLPASRARYQFEGVVPKHIFSDYVEACLIESLSPKASAALARRVVQAVLIDFYKVKRELLAKQIEAVRDKVEPDLYTALHEGVRNWGNVGAHPDKEIFDVEPDVVRKLILVIEELFEDTYLAADRRARLLEEVSLSYKEAKPAPDAS